MRAVIFIYFFLLTYFLHSQDTTFLSQIICFGDEFLGEKYFQDSVVTIPNPESSLDFVTYFIVVSKVNDFEILGAKDICRGDTIELEIPVFSSIQWNTGETNNRIKVSRGGEYSVTVLNNRGCQHEQKTTLLESNIDISLKEEPRTCNNPNQRVAFDIKGHIGTDPYIMALQGNTIVDMQTGSIGFLNADEGLYIVEVEDSIGCLSLDSIEVQGQADYIFKIGEDQFLPKYSDFSLSPSANFTINEITCKPIDRITKCGADEIDLLVDTSFVLTVQVKDTLGCVFQDSINILANSEIKLYIPNAFSPNNDGQNDDFIIYAGQQVEQVEDVSFFDRWGNLVVNKTNIVNNKEMVLSDDSFQDLVPGVFSYVLRLKLEDGETQLILGSVTTFK